MFGIIFLETYNRAPRSERNFYENSLYATLFFCTKRVNAASTYKRKSVVYDQSTLQEQSGPKIFLPGILL